jgi:site-specific recombinase XerD
MHKTNKERFIKLTETTKRIVKKHRSKEKYLFNTKVDWNNEEESIDRRNSFYNQSLKDACEAAGITKVSFHTARHAFADHAKKMGLDIHTIKELLGHTLVSTTEVYMKSFYTEETDLAMDKMFKK